MTKVLFHGVDPTIVSLACQIARLKQWGNALGRAAAAKETEISALRTRMRVMRVMSDVGERIEEALRSDMAKERADLQRVISERDGLMVQVQDQRAEIERLRADIAEELNESPPAPPEASHDTTAGKEAAESASEIKLGDVVEVAIGGDETVEEVEEVPGYVLPVGRVVAKCDVRAAAVSPQRKVLR